MLSQEEYVCDGLKEKKDQRWTFDSLSSKQWPWASSAGYVSVKLFDKKFSRWSQAKN